MKTINNIAYTLLTVVLVLISYESRILAQGTIMRSNEDFGNKGIIFADNSAYEYTFFGDENMRVIYDYTLAFKDKKLSPINSEYILQIGTSTTKFYSEIQHQCDSMLVQAEGKEYLTPRYNLYDKANFLFVQDCFYIEPSTGNLTFTGRLVTEDFEYNETLPGISWQMLPGEKTICGYSCKKAKGSFRGRDWEVWYTEQIPSSSGPWKLRGLPGVILSATDSNGECSFVAKTVRKGNGKIFKAQYPYIKIKREQYTKMQQQYLEQQGAFSSQHTSRSGIRITQIEKQKPLPAVIELEKK